MNLESRLCINCYRTISTEMELRNDPTCVKLNILRQTNRATCLICNGVGNLRRLTIEARVKIFIDINIFIPEGTHIAVMTI